MNRELRALGRELRAEPEPGRGWRAARGWLLHHLPEVLAAGLLVYAGQAAQARLGPLWAGLLAAGLAGAMIGWGRSRRWLVALAGYLVTRSRLRPALAELKLSRPDGRPPRTLLVLPTAVGERVWLLCPVRVAVEDIAGETDRLCAACFAREVRVTGSRRFSALVRVEVIRRQPAGHRAVESSPLVGRVPVAPGAAGGAT